MEEKEGVFYSLAIEQAQFGYFKYIVLAICGLIIAAVSAPGSSLLEGRNLITCKLMLDHDQRMKINLYTIIALIGGGPLIAVPSDLASRLKPLVLSLIFYGLSTLGLGFCTEYYCFAFFSVFRAFWTSALLAVTTVYVAEIQTPRYRGSGLCFLQLFWLFGCVFMPVLSIPWRASQLIFGAFALGIAIFVGFFFTESPRLLLTLGKKAAALESLEKIYKKNFGNRGVDYPVKILVDDFSSEAQNYVKLRTYVPKASRPPWYCVFIILQIQFFFNLCYFTMSYWFREMKSFRHVLIFPIVPNYVECNLGEKYLPDKLEVQNEKIASNSTCDSDDIDTDYYKEVLIVGFATLPILIWMILSFDYLGRSYFTTLSHVLAGLLSFLLHFLIGTRHYLLYTSLMETMWVVSATTSSCLATEFFKTRFRLLGVALANGFGYIGMAMGIYGVLLTGSTSCIFVISITGILVTVSGLLTLSLPDIGGVHLK